MFKTVYKHQKPPRSFDDTYIKSVDGLINSFLNADIPEGINEYLSKEQLACEYNSLFIKTPRQVGKTTYLLELAKCFKRSVIVYPSHDMKVWATREYCSPYIKNKQFVTFSSIIDVRNLIGNLDRYDVDAVIFDELHRSMKTDINDTVGRLVHHYPNAVFIGLYT